MNPPLSMPLWELGYLEPFCPPLSIAVSGRLSVPFRADSFLPMADLSRKRSRDRLAPRREPYRQRLAAGAYLSFRRSRDNWLARFRGRDKKQQRHALGEALEFYEAKRRAGIGSSSNARTLSSSAR
jgi:hypothetical protein